MFNFEAETFLILYSHGAGGRFLQLCIEDSDFEVYRDYLRTNINAHAHNGHQEFSKDLIEQYPHQNRYAFVVHPDYITASLQFVRKCTNLKIISIDVSTERSQELLAQRRQKLGSPALCSYEQSLKTSHGKVCKLWFGQSPVLQLELEDYWDPEKAIPILTEFFATHHLNPRWQELYQIWHSNAIKDNS